MNKQQAKYVLQNTGYIGNEVGVAFEVATKSMDKLEKIEEIVNCELIAGRRNYKSCYQTFWEIVDVIQDREVLEQE